MDDQKTNWLLVILLWVVGLLAAAQFAKVSLLLPELSAELDREIAQISILISVVSITGILFGVMAGAWVARLGAPRVILAALALGALLSVLQRIELPFWLLLSLRVFEGVSHLAMVVATPTLMTSIAAARDRSVVMGLWATFFGVSFAACAALFPLIGSVQAIWMLHGAAMASLGIILWRLLPKQPGQMTPVTQFWAVHREIYTTPCLYLPALAFIWHTLMFIALLALAPPLFPNWVGPLLALIALIGTFSAGFLARYIAPDRIAIAGFAATCLLAVPAFTDLFAEMPSLQVSVVLLTFVCIGFVPGASFAAIPHFNKGAEDNARAQGAVAQLGNVGTAAGTPIYAFFSDGMAFVTMALCIGGILSLLWIGQLVRRDR